MDLLFVGPMGIHSCWRSVTNWRQKGREKNTEHSCHLCKLPSFFLFLMSKGLLQNLQQTYTHSWLAIYFSHLFLTHPHQQAGSASQPRKVPLRNEKPVLPPYCWGTEMASCTTGQLCCCMESESKPAMRRDWVGRPAGVWLCCLAWGAHLSRAPSLFPWEGLKNKSKVP